MDETESYQFKPLREASSNAVSRSARSQPRTCPEDLAIKRAGILLGCYRKGEAEEPEIYAGAVAAVLSTYPEAIAYRVTDPRTGLPGRSQWLPSVQEVTAACEEEMAPARAEAARNARRAHTRDVLGQPRSALVLPEQWAALAANFPKPEQKFRAPEQLAAEYASRPIGLSAELREKMRLEPK